MSFYTSLTGINAATAMLGVTSNNIANVGTTGFKRSRADFGDIFATSPLQKASSTVGQGVSLKQVSQEFGQGNITFSANALDLAITGDGFFPLRSADGLSSTYTRNGSFMLNEQYNVVNSAGQRLMAATVDSTGSANINERVVLTIPQKTSGEAQQTTNVDLGLNFPADASVISAPFSRIDPSSFNKSTAFTVYDKGGNGYLATIYYVKTQNANQNSPFNKWQTYVYVGNDQVAASLVQSTDVSGKAQYVNQYGQIKSYEEVKDELTTGKTQLISLDELTDKRISNPAAVSGLSVSEDISGNQTFAAYALANVDGLAALFDIKIDGTLVAETIDLSYLNESTLAMNGVTIAAEITKQLNRKFGDEYNFDFSDSNNSIFSLTSTAYKDGDSKVIPMDIDFSNTFGTGVVNTKVNIAEATAAIQAAVQAAEPVAVTGVTEKASVTFPDIENGETVIVGGTTFTAAASVTGAQLAAYFAGGEIASGHGSFTGSVPVTGYTAAQTESTAVTVFTSTTANTPIAPNLSVTGTGTGTGTSAAISITEGVTAVTGVAVTGVTEKASVTFPDIENGETVIVGGTTFTAAASVTGAQLAAYFAGGEIASGHGSFTGSVPVTGYTAAQTESTAVTVFTSTTANTPIAPNLSVTGTGTGTGTSAAISITEGVTAVTGATAIIVTYDYSTQSFKFVQGIETLTLARATGVNNEVLNLGATPVTLDEAGLSGLKMLPNGNTPDRLKAEQRYGMKMSYDPVNKSFSLLSGTTGDKSSLELIVDTTVNAAGITLLGLFTDKVEKTNLATRGIASQPAIASGSPPTINVTTNFAVDSTNNKFLVTVDGIKSTVVIPPSPDYSLESFMSKLQKGINSIGSNEVSGAPTTVSGVKVTFNFTKNAFVFTTGTAGSDSFIKISGSSDWGLDQVEAGRGSTSSWIKPSQHKDVVGGALQPKYIDKDGKETTSSDGFVNLPAWSPIYLDKGELTFDTSGKLYSPVKGTQLETVFLEGGKGALTININYGASTQYTSPFAVLSQSQDGAPEGDLVGVTIGNDGLVSASFSNGTQKSLAKILLVNFSSPSGLRQVGDSSFLASAASGKPVLGTAGSAGFGTLRAGATERANVDLTQELVDLITAQRNFQANAKAIETSSTMTSAIINMRS